MFRNLSLNLKITVTLVLVFALIVAVFLGILYPFQRNQLDDLVRFNESMLANLEKVYRNRLIYDVIGEEAADESLVVTLQELMAVDPGILFARVADPEGGLYATTDPQEVRTVAENARAAGILERDESASRDRAGAKRPVMLRRRSQPTRIFGYEGAAFVVRGDRAHDRTLADEIAGLGPDGELTRATIGTTPALVLTRALEVEQRSYGSLQLAYSIEVVERNKRRTGMILLGLIGSLFILLLLLLNVLISRIVIGPLRTVFRGMRAAGAGDLDQELPIRSRDEVGEMSSIFNQMVRKLRQSKSENEQYSRNLERMVSDRTRELRRSEEDLTHLKNYLSAVLDNVGAGVLSIDREGRVATFNERAEEILDLEGEAVEGRSVEEALSGVALAPLREAIVEALADTEEPTAAGEVVVKASKGKRSLSVRVTRFGGDETDRDVGSVVVFDDVTQLIYSKKLTAWKEAVEKVIHEIKNPLTPIQLNTQQLRAAFADRSERFDQMFDRGTKTILSSVENLQQLVSDFSAFYRLHPVSLTSHDVNGMLDEVLPMYSEGLREGLRIDCELGVGMPPIDADPGHLKRVFANLIQNGLDSMEGKKGVLTVRTEYRAERKLVAVSVEDQGRGMEPDEMEKIFEPYFTTKIKGTGLGLIISKQIVEDHRGEIRLRSKPGRGTRVDLTFPVSRKARKQEA